MRQLGRIMTRKSIIFLFTLLTITAVVIPILLTLYFSWVLAERSEKAKLSELAALVLQRGTTSLKEAKEALQLLAKFQDTPCSASHVSEMRKIVFSLFNIDEIGHFENNLLKCTSWGMIDQYVPLTSPDIITPEGIEIALKVYPLVSQKRPVMALFYKNHNVLIDPYRFVDVITEPDIKIALALTSGHIISTLHQPDPAILEQILKEKNPSDYLVYVNKKDNVTVIAMEPRSHIFVKLTREFIILLPFGLLMIISFVTIVIWASRRRLSLLGELKVAVKKQDFLVYYQPLINLQTGECIGAEALIRWQLADGSWQRPDTFIPLAEQHGLIAPITDYVITTVMRDLKSLLNVDRQLHIAVNVAAEDFKTGRILEIVEATRKNSGIEPQQIWLEATERSFMDVKAVQKTILRARELGYPVIIDDFGTGYSSLAYLQGLPLSALKIDKSFIESIGTRSATSHVTYHIIKMAKALQLKLVAEGIENQVQEDYLRKHEVEYAQGWLYAKAMPLEEFVEFYQKNKLLFQSKFTSTFQR